MASPAWARLRWRGTRLSVNPSRRAESILMKPCWSRLRCWAVMRLGACWSCLMILTRRKKATTRGPESMASRHSTKIPMKWWPDRSEVAIFCAMLRNQGRRMPRKESCQKWWKSKRMHPCRTWWTNSSKESNLKISRGGEITRTMLWTLYWTTIISSYGSKRAIRTILMIPKSSQRHNWRK